MIVTTSMKGQERLEEEARQVAHTLQCEYVTRYRKSVGQIFEEQNTDKVIVIAQDRMKYVLQGHEHEPFFFHPSSAMFRVKRLLRQERDPFVEACQLKEGMTLFDGTFGLGSDGIVASFITGATGQVVGVESVPVLGLIVQKGLQRWQTKLDPLNEAMRRITLQIGSHVAVLKETPTDAFDVVYFDPMFDLSVSESVGIAPLKTVANYEPLTKEAIQEAKRVAKQRVVLKASRESAYFENLAFQPIVRKHASHWYGTIELEH
ncbi:class I SAM-dependent methyltransferase [Caldalkalibacillus salinus]|uniref:class I SAM-dependent methyltransferase n=1 Tax=Caldalkalibacillus salinus TaxID=2803787 RepID=UPI001924F520|nr:class I SAM-dependent methyltransferase [Caldalkalibacillus salinus]